MALHIMGQRCTEGPRQASSRRAIALGAAFAVALAACAGAAAGTNDRYPEEKRPEAPRSASDGEVLGAQGQDPADTLDASLTNEHSAPRSPHAEEPPNEAARERLKEEECIEASKATPNAAGADVRRKPVCPPVSESRPREERP
jgi:hypothetical protein